VSWLSRICCQNKMNNGQKNATQTANTLSVFIVPSIFGCGRVRGRGYRSANLLFVTLLLFMLFMSLVAKAGCA
jgi:hypothetical protein